jgi:hypothetical protein
MPARNAHGTSHQDKAECLGAAVALDLGVSMKAREFFSVLWQYRCHGPIYATRQAWRIAVQGLPF